MKYEPCEATAGYRGGAIPHQHRPLRFNSFRTYMGTVRIEDPDADPMLREKARVWGNSL